VLLTALLAVAGGSPWAAGGYLAAVAVISLLAVLAMGRWLPAENLTGAADPGPSTTGTVAPAA
jgi:hypothetical protein